MWRENLEDQEKYRFLVIIVSSLEIMQLSCENIKGTGIHEYFAPSIVRLCWGRNFHEAMTDTTTV